MILGLIPPHHALGLHTASVSPHFVFRNEFLCSTALRHQHVFPASRLLPVLPTLLNSSLLFFPVVSCSGPWDYQVCTEFLGQELPYFPAADSSMFWDQGPFDWEGLVAHCKDSWGVAPEKHWSVAQHGGLDWRYVGAGRWGR
eukprot:GHUV01047473.1.p1 GENE.GHUV01047473.1~~GHUV01047473.1.p1  ORF type:complete len:142 (-),score=15.52 GHUV01047473.1:227-652(-)